MGHDWIHNADALLPGGSVLRSSAGCPRAAPWQLRLDFFMDCLPRAIRLRMAVLRTANRCARTAAWGTLRMRNAGAGRGHCGMGENDGLARTLALPDWGTRRGWNFDYCRRWSTRISFCAFRGYIPGGVTSRVVAAFLQRPRDWRILSVEPGACQWQPSWNRD